MRVGQLAAASPSDAEIMGELATTHSHVSSVLVVKKDFAAALDRARRALRESVFDWLDKA